MNCSDLLREFALEPSLLNRWRDLRFYYDNFGVSRGRLISRFPKKWKRMVYESISNDVGEIERKKIEDRLSVIDDKIMKMNREYDGNLDWLQNAERSHTVMPFHAIVASINPNHNDSVLLSEDVDDQNDLWQCDTEIPVPRNSVSLAIVVQNLFQISNSILFIDPHFGPESGRFRITLQHFLETAIKTGNSFSRIEYHLSAKSTFEFFENECKIRLPQIIPTGISVAFKRWRQLDLGEQLHPRYILTDWGGFRFEGGLDAGQAGETVDVSILDTSLYKQRWADYQVETASFDFIDEVIITGERDVGRL